MFQKRTSVRNWIAELRIQGQNLFSLRGLCNCLKWICKCLHKSHASTCKQGVSAKLPEICRAAECVLVLLNKRLFNIACFPSVFHARNTELCAILTWNKNRCYTYLKKQVLYYWKGPLPAFRGGPGRGRLSYAFRPLNDPTPTPPRKAGRGFPLIRVCWLRQADFRVKNFEQIYSAPH